MAPRYSNKFGAGEAMTSGSARLHISPALPKIQDTGAVMGIMMYHPVDARLHK